MKYYYTDPLAAAWMAKHFDFVYEETFVLDIEIARGKAIDERECWFQGRATIQHQCLHLLEPQQGDLAVYGYDNQYAGYFINGKEPCISQAGDREIDNIDVKYVRVLERKGIAFMWPEVEV